MQMADNGFSFGREAHCFDWWHLLQSKQTTAAAAAVAIERAPISVVVAAGL